MENKERMREALKAEEAEFRRQMMEKLAEDDRIEQMNAQKRRMKQLGNVACMLHACAIARDMHVV